jgi:hypothetical protein
MGGGAYYGGVGKQTKKGHHIAMRPFRLVFGRWLRQF